MGAVQSIPVVGEAVTAVDSGVKVVASASCAVVGELLDDEGAKDAAKKFINDAGNSWVEYSERNLIAAPVRATIHSIAGDEDEAWRVVKKMGKSTEGVIDNTPVIGHIKGVGHYIAGDTEHGNECMKGASRTLAVAGAGALTGGVGGGVIAGGFVGASTGVAYDGVVTAIDCSVNDEKGPYGVWAAVDQVIESDKKGDGYGVIDSTINIGYSLTGDFLTGSAAAKAAKSVNKSSKQRADLREKIGKEATKDVVDTAKKLQEVTKGIEGDNHVCTKAKNLETGKEAFGTNKRCRNQTRLNEFNKKGKASGYKSKTNAWKGHSDQFPRKPGVLENTAKDMNMDIKANGNKGINNCAEHQALNKLGTHGLESKIRTTTVTSCEGNIVAMERCGTCKQFGDLMGNVATDGINGMPVPTRQFTLDTSAAAIRNAAMYGAVGIAVCIACGEGEDKCDCSRG